MAEVLELEQVEMMPMPVAFDGYVERTVCVSSTCLISVARDRYSVPCECVGQWVSSRLYPSRIVVIADETVIASACDELASQGTASTDSSNGCWNICFSRNMRIARCVR